MRNWIGLGVSLCLGLVCILVADASAPSRSLSATELLAVRGGGTLQHHCCKDRPECAGKTTTCATPAPNEDPTQDAVMRCSLRKTVVIGKLATKACRGIEYGVTCNYSDADYKCKYTMACAFNNTAIRCMPNLGGGANDVVVPATCTPNCTNP